MNDIIERLLDSEEHATDEAIPPVAEDAAEEIGALREQLEIAEACARCEHEKRLGIEQQRDELLAALKEVKANAGNPERVYEITKAIITKVEDA